MARRRRWSVPARASAYRLEGELHREWLSPVERDRDPAAGTRPAAGTAR
jgi:hypothetical protein